jgi:hypothetical protein
MARTTTVIEAKQGSKIRLRRGPFAGAVIIVRSVDAHGAVTGKLATPLCVAAEDYDVIHP